MDRWLILLLCWCCLSNVRIDAAEWQAHLVDDATLHDVVFVDAEYGWAVGDHGMICHTTDSGRSWQRQPAPTSVDLHGASFVDRQNGWAVGGSTSPYLWTSRATVLRTTDGGKTWEPHLALLPALDCVKFFDAKHGVAWGRGSGGEPFGVFASGDSGLNWRPVTVGWQSAWSGGDFINSHTGIVVGPGQAARITNGDATKLELSEHTIRAVQLGRADGMIPPGTAWAVGDNGTIRRSQDGGASWSAIDVLPDDLSAIIHWHAVATNGKHVWIAGSPGTVVLHSADGGESWQGHATGSHVPLREITFVDDKNGWAVGDFGTVLHTNDGGQTWQVQRRGGERAAVLVICSDDHQIPFETLAKLNSDGYRTVVHLFQPKRGGDNPTHHARLAESLAVVGCIAIRPPSLYSGEASSGQEASDNPDAFVEHIALQLRVWRPAVLIVSGGDEMYEHAAETAIKQAADARALPHIGDQLALPAWQVSRVFIHLPPGQRGTHRVQSADIVPMADKSLGELATAARSLLDREFHASPETNEFLLKASHAGEPTSSVDDLAAGLSIQPGSDCRRPLAQEQAPADPQAQRRLAEKRRNLANIFRFAEGNPALLAQVGRMMGDLAPGAAAALLVELAEQFEDAGQMQLAVDTRELLVRRGGDDPLVEATLVWLVQFYASGETAHTYRSELVGLSHREFYRDKQGDKPPGSLNDEKGVIAASAHVDHLIPDHIQQRFTRAVQLSEHIAHTRPLLNAEPQLRVPAAIAERRLSRIEPQALAAGNGAIRIESETPDASAFGSVRAQRYLESLALRYPGEAWQECGAVERWLSKPDKPIPGKSRITCRFTGTRPTLDGHLDDALWQSKATELISASAVIKNPKSEIVLSYDEEYLYLAVSCETLPQKGVGSLFQKPSANGRESAEKTPDPFLVRTYDADLTEQDRVRILLDLDRDYTTWFALTVDHRGWTNDACWQDSSWNPKWFVAAADDEQTWTVEAAIPWAELTEAPPENGDAWAVAAVRIVPGVGTHNLTGNDVSEVGPQQFGVLLFK